MPFDLGDLFPHLASLCGAYALALPIGWDRERNERSAGLRTFPLVALASCGFVQATELHIQGSPEAQARIIEGLITGIGFIGGGAVGAAVGLGSYDVAVVIAVITILTFRGLSPLKQQKTPGDDVGPPEGRD